MKAEKNRRFVFKSGKFKRQAAAGSAAGKQPFLTADFTGSMDSQSGSVLSVEKESEDL